MTPAPPREAQSATAVTAAGWRMGRPWQLVLLGIGALLVWAALREVQWPVLADLLAGLGFGSLAAILVISLTLLPLMTARWWWLLRILGQPVGLSTLVAYRTAANAVGYFTPGPQFGGEPLQVLLLHRRQLIPAPTATLSVALDRLLELIAGFVILLGSLVLAGKSQATLASDTVLIVILATLTVLGGLLAALLIGGQPFSRLLALGSGLFHRWWPGKAGRPWPALEAVREGEVMAEEVFRQAKGRLLAANLFSLLHWLGVFAECWLFFRLFGYPLSIPQLAAVVVAMRLAFLTPLPAGVGALEFALGWTTAALGLGPALGIGICLVVRARDLLFGLAGMLLAMKYLTGLQRSVMMDKSRTGP